MLFSCTRTTPPSLSATPPSRTACPSLPAASLDATGAQLLEPKAVYDSDAREALQPNLPTAAVPQALDATAFARAAAPAREIMLMELLIVSRMAGPTTS